jgi:outer membrane protein TolC
MSRALPWAALVLLLAGCSADYRRMREEQADRVLFDRAARSCQILAERGALDREACIALALDENLDLAAASIRERLATIDRQTAFGAFLPTIEVGFNWHRSVKPVELATGGGYVQMSDQQSHALSFSVSQPLLVPQAFVAYQMFREGEDIAALVTARLRQQIAHLVTERYYAVLAAEEQLRQLTSDVAQLEVLGGELVALAREGLIVASELEQARALLAAARLRVAEAQRHRRRQESLLLQAMGLDPLASLNLRPSPPLEPPGGDLADQVLSALLNRLELQIADRELQLARQEARLALVSWLPKLLGFGSVDYTSDSHYRSAWNASYGIGAVLTVLDGFRSIGAYRGAKQQAAQIDLRRDQQALGIALEVQTARQQVISADELLAVVEGSLHAVQTTVAEGEAQWREGLLRPSERLSLHNALSQAQAQHLLASYQRQVAIATLIDVLGAAPIDPALAQHGSEPQP